MPSRRATAELAVFSGEQRHSTRWMPRTSNAQSIIARTASVTSPRPRTSSLSHTPISHVEQARSNTRNRVPPTSSSPTYSP